MKDKFNSNLMILGIELMLFLSLFSTILPSWLGYADDVFCAFVAILLVFNIIAGKRVLKFHILLVLLVPIGLMGNFVYDIQSDSLLAITDAFMFLKPYILLLYITTVINADQARHIYVVIAKVLKTILHFYLDLLVQLP